MTEESWFLYSAESLYIHIRMFLILQRWDTKILPDIKAFPPCDILYLFCLILFMKFIALARLKDWLCVLTFFTVH